jgi:hypothetical protein
MRSWWQRREDGVARHYKAISHSDGHDATLHRDLSCRQMPAQRLAQSGTKPVKFDTGLSQARQLNDGARPNVKSGSLREGAKIDPDRRDVLTKATRLEYIWRKRAENLAHQQVNLPKVWTPWVAAEVIEMTNCGTRMRVVSHAMPDKNLDAGILRFGEAVTRTSGNSENLGHTRLVSSA